METAQGQFIVDFFLVADNTKEIYDQLIKMTGDSDSTGELAERLDNWWDAKIHRLTGSMADDPALFIQQVMLGWGSDTWFKIARRLEETYKQTEQVGA